MKETLDGFGVSFNALFLMLRTFLVDDTSARIASILHPSARVSGGGRISAIAGYAVEVIEVEKLRVPMLRAFMVIFPNPADVLRLAEQSLAKLDALLAEADKHPDFAPPAVFSSASLNVPVAA